MERNENFYVCLYKDQDGKPIGHATSASGEFPSEIAKQIDADGSKSQIDFPDLFETFRASMLGYMDMLPFIAGLSEAISYGIRSFSLESFCQENSVSVLEEERRKIYELPINKYYDFRSIEAKGEISYLVSKQVPKMLIIGIVSSLDHHISQLIKVILRKHPKMISDSEKLVSVKDIFLSDSLDEFKDYLLDKEVENVMRRSFEDQVDWFEKRLSILKPIKDEYDKWIPLVEIFERRNLFAHANGIVNNTYIKKISPVSNSSAKKMSIGDELFASSKYFVSSLENICEFGVKICQVVWRKLFPEDSDAADDALGDFGYELIERGEYRLAINILEFAKSLKGKKDESRRRVDIVNLANAYKLDGKVEKAMATLDGEDWGIVSDNFAISVAAVKDEVDTVILYMRRLSQSGDWNGTFLEQWPVFFNIREKEKFLAEFETLFGRKFVPVPKNRHKVLTSFFEQAQTKRNKTSSLNKRRKRNLILDVDKEDNFPETNVKSSQHRD